MAPHQFVLDHKRFVTVAVEPEQCIKQDGIISPKHAVFEICEQNQL